MKYLEKPLVSEWRSTRSISGRGGRLAAGQEGRVASDGRGKVGLVHRVREGLNGSGGKAPGERSESGGPESDDDSRRGQLVGSQRDLDDLVMRLERLRRVLPGVGSRVDFSDELKRRLSGRRPGGPAWRGVRVEGDDVSTSDQRHG